MKNINQYIIEKLKIRKSKNQTIVVKDNKEFEKVLTDYITTLADNVEIHLDLQHIDISELKRLDAPFHNISKIYKYKIKSIDVTGWDTSNIESMYALFYDLKNCEKIIGIEDWEISNVTNMWAMFAFCKNLKLNLTHWDISDLCNTNLIVDNAPGVKLNQDKL